MNKYIVFDLDDTLFYEVEFLKSAYKEIAKKLSQDTDYTSLYKYMLDLYHIKEDVFGYLANQYNYSKDEILKIYREHLPDIVLRPGVRDILDSLKKQNIKMGLLTDGRSLTQRNKIKALDIEKYFDKIVISEELGSEKPNEKNYIAFFIPDHDFFYIADNPKKDFITPNALGWRTIMIEDDENKKIHEIPDSLKDIYLAEKTVSWQFFYTLIK